MRSGSAVRRGKHEETTTTSDGLWQICSSWSRAAIAWVPQAHMSASGPNVPPSEILVRGVSGLEIATMELAYCNELAKLLRIR